MMRSIIVILGLLLCGERTLGAEWLWLESPHFDMISRADERSARELLIELEQFRTQFLKFTGLKLEVPRRNHVVLFDREEQFEKYKPRFNGKTSNVAGYFSGTAIDAQIALVLGRSRADAKRVIYHEYVHALYDELGWQPPIWFNEGSAEVFSTFEVKGETAYFGRPPAWHIRLLKEHRLTPLPTIFATTEKSADYNEGLRQNLFYAESWLFVHYFAFSRDTALRGQLNSFLALLYAGNPVNEDTFRAAFGVGMAEVQQHLESYVYGGAFGIATIPVDRGNLDKEIRARKATDTEIERELTILDIRVHDSPDSPYRLISLSERDPASPRPHEAMAVLAMRSNDPQRLQEELSRAAELGTTNIGTYFYLAKLLVATWLSQDVTVYKQIGENTASQLRTLLQRVVRECPDSVEAWDGFARTEAFAPQPDRATVDQIESKVRTWQEEPQKLQTLMLVGFARKRLGNLEAAGAIARYIDSSPLTANSTRRLNRTLLGELLKPKSDFP